RRPARQPRAAPRRARALRRASAASPAGGDRCARHARPRQPRTGRRARRPRRRNPGLGARRAGAARRAPGTVAARPRRPRLRARCADHRCRRGARLAAAARPGDSLMNDILRVAVVGHTNTGKTSLLRTLARDAGFGAVSDSAGTTRHVEGLRLMADGSAAVELYDTPGMEDAIAL